MKNIAYLIILICFVSGTAYGQTQQMDLKCSLLQYTTNCSNGGDGSYDPKACYFDIWGYTTPIYNRDYAIIGVVNGTSFIEITDPCNPVQVGFVGTVSSTHRDIKTYQNYAYIVTDGGGLGLEIVDLTWLDVDNLTTPYVSLINTWISVIPNYFTGSAHNVFIDVPTARLFLCGGDVGPDCDHDNDGPFGTDEKPCGILMVDLTDPTLLTPNPAQVLYFDNWVHDLYVKDDTLFACAADNTIELFDISNNTFDNFIDLPYPPPLFPHNVWTTEDGKYMVTADENDDGAAIFWDIRDKTQITETDRFYVKKPGSRMHNVFIKGNFCYIAHMSHGLVVLDIYDINNVIEVANYDTYPADNDGGAWYGAWGVFPFLNSDACHIIVSDMQAGMVSVTFRDDYVLLNMNLAPGMEKGFVAKNTITATNYTVPVTASANLVAGVEIKIDGESVIEGEFIARIEDPCAPSTFVSQKTGGGSSGNETDLTEKAKNNKSSIINQQSSISIHPNPTTSSFTISGNYELPAVMEMYNIIGERVKQLTINKEQLTIDVSSLSKGLYVWQVGTARGKLVLE